MQYIINPAKYGNASYFLEELDKIIDGTKIYIGDKEIRAYDVYLVKTHSDEIQANETTELLPVDGQTKFTGTDKLVICAPGSGVVSPGDNKQTVQPDSDLYDENLILTAIPDGELLHNLLIEKNSLPIAAIWLKRPDGRTKYSHIDIYKQDGLLHSPDELYELGRKYSK